MDFFWNSSVAGSLPSELSPEKSSTQENSQLDELFPGENKELHFELEWLSVFLEDCFSSNGCTLSPSASLNKTHLAQPEGPCPTQPEPCEAHPRGFLLGIMGPLPGKPRSRGKRRGRAEVVAKEKAGSGSSPGGRAGQGRRCSHCMAQRTPQWRAGPMGPKTLCNACGVRFKSGRLLPEYRPAKSTTFLRDRHSNSHKQVLEMRMAMQT